MQTTQSFHVIDQNALDTLVDILDNSTIVYTIQVFPEEDGIRVYIEFDRTLIVEFYALIEHLIYIPPEPEEPEND